MSGSAVPQIAIHNISFNTGTLINVNVQPPTTLSLRTISGFVYARLMVHRHLAQLVPTYDIRLAQNGGFLYADYTAMAPGIPIDITKERPIDVYFSDISWNAGSNTLAGNIRIVTVLL